MSWGMSMGTQLGIVASIPTKNINSYVEGYDILLFNRRGWCGYEKFDYCQLMIDKFRSIDGERMVNGDGSTCFELSLLENGELDETMLNHQYASLSEYKEAAKRFRELGIDTTIHNKYWIFDYLFDYNGPIDCCEVCSKNEKYAPPMENKKGPLGIEIGVVNCEAKGIPHKWYKWDRAKTLKLPRYEVCYDVVINGVEYEVAPYGSNKAMRLQKQYTSKEEAQKDCNLLNDGWNNQLVISNESWMEKIKDFLGKY